MNFDFNTLSNPYYWATVAGMHYIFTKFAQVISSAPIELQSQLLIAALLTAPSAFAAYKAFENPENFMTSEEKETYLADLSTEEKEIFFEKLGL